MNVIGSIELSAHTLVMIILSVVVFGLGISLAYDMFGAGQEVLEHTPSGKRLAELSCTPSQKVCVLDAIQEVEHKDTGVIGLKITNVFTKADFRITLTSGQPLGYDGTTPLTTPLTILQTTPTLVTLLKHETKDIVFGVQVPSHASPGQYQFNLVIEYNRGQGFQPYHAQTVYVTVI